MRKSLFGEFFIIFGQPVAWLLVNCFISNKEPTLKGDICRQITPLTSSKGLDNRFQLNWV